MRSVRGVTALAGLYCPRGGRSAVGSGLAAAAMAALALASGDAAAQTLEVAPVTIELLPGQMAATLTVSNRGDRKTVIQTRAFAWRQSPAGDELIPTKDLAISPPMSELPAGETQLIRIVLRRASSEHETAYRLLLDQIPSAGAPGTVQVALRISMPVFAEPEVRGAPDVDWRISLDRTGRAELLARNRGARRLRVARLAVNLPGGATAPVQDSGAPYVLAGAEHRWLIKAAPGVLRPGMVVHVSATSDQGRVDATPPVAPSP